MGRFADRLAVTDRFEGTIPTDRYTWVDTRILDVEAILIGLVPSLSAPDSVIGIARLARVKTLVCDKVLDLYRNPGRANQRTETVGPFSDAVSYPGDNRSTSIAFTQDELRAVRLRTKRSNLGMAKVAAWDAVASAAAKTPPLL